MGGFPSAEALGKLTLRLRRDGNRSQLSQQIGFMRLAWLVTLVLPTGFSLVFHLSVG